MSDATLNALVDELARSLMLGALLEQVRTRWGAYELLDHFQQGEFHHDLVLSVHANAELPGGVLVAATNCNGGVKEVLWFEQRPSEHALWRARCPDNAEFAAEPAHARAVARTAHWFDPCELLTANARSELREEFRARQCGGGWVPRR
ncbi:MAG TPA: hypothetical protein VGM29_12645 [Polyangiaceae bacterium]|jgi:hypothetical protein